MIYFGIVCILYLFNFCSIAEFVLWYSFYFLLPHYLLEMKTFFTFCTVELCLTYWSVFVWPDYLKMPDGNQASDVILVLLLLYIITQSQLISVLDEWFLGSLTILCCFRNDQYSNNITLKMINYHFLCYVMMKRNLLYYDLCLLSLYLVLFNILCTYTYYYYNYVFFIIQSLNFVFGWKKNMSFSQTVFLIEIN